MDYYVNTSGFSLLAAHEMWVEWLDGEELRWCGAIGNTVSSS